jgi:uncharacterized pyridoxal phosphate-containing UPF0001 family protein
MDNASIEKVKKAITSCIDRSNVDRIARVMTSNLCENYFSILVKFSQGKRLNLGQSDSWAILAHFVAGLQSNKDFSSLVMQQFGVWQSVVRNEGGVAILKRERKQAKGGNRATITERSVMLERFCQRPEWGRKRLRVPPIAAENLA